MNTILAVFIGGGLGSVCRYFVSKATVHYFVSSFPIATLISNFLSSLILALLVLLYGHKLGNDSMLKWFLVVGFCGGFSTFSTFSYETFLLLKSAHYGLAFLNVTVSVAFTLALMYLIIRNL